MGLSRSHGRRPSVAAGAAILVASIACSDLYSRDYPSTTLAPGVGLGAADGWEDTEWMRVVPEITSAWREYLVLAGAGEAGAARAAARWSAAERERWPRYDIGRSLIDHAIWNADAVITDVRPARPGDTVEYVVKTLFSRDSGRTPIALLRVYAIREEGRWVFANSLPRATADWRRETVGPFTYVIQPGYAFSIARARRAVAFADSLASALGAPRVGALTYYLTDTPEELYRIIGLDWAETPGGRGGGWASQVNRQIFSGDALLGEEYRHELAHYVVAPLVARDSGQWITSEGFATWLGGASGRDYPETMAAYGRYLRRHPEISLDSLVRLTNADARPAGALLMQMAFEKGGLPAVVELLRVPDRPGALEPAIERVLGQPLTEIGREWRRKAEAFGAAPP